MFTAPPRQAVPHASPCNESRAGTGAAAQAVGTERGGIKVYTAALSVAVDEDLREEWSKYLDETTRHERILIAICEALSLDPGAATPGRR